MGYISIKITDIQIPNDFRILLKPDGGESKPYPIIGGLTWTDYGSLAGMPIYSGGTTEIWLSGSTYDFQYGTTYWIKLEEYDYPDRYVVKNIRIFDAIAFESAVSPTPSATMIVSASPTPSITRTATPSRTVPVTPTPTPTITITPTETPSISVSSSIGASQSPSPTQTPSITPTNVTSEVYFASLAGETATMGVNNPAGRTFNITFYYRLEAVCDNESNYPGQDYNQATTYLFISTGVTENWNEIASVTAEVSGGNYPIAQSDTQVLTGTTTLNGITDVTKVKVLGQYEWVWLQNGKQGYIDVQIINVTVNTGTAGIICDDAYHVGSAVTPDLSCESIPPTPSASTSVTPTVTRTPSPSPEVIKVLVYNNSGNYTNITDVWVGEDPVFDMSPEFPLYPGDNGLGRSRRGTGTWDVIVYLFGSDVVTKKMTLIDSTGYEHCQNVNPGDTQVNFFGIQANASGWPDPYDYYGNVSMIIEFFNGGLCPSPPPQTPSITPTVTKTPSVTPTIGLSPSRTPTSTPIVFAYNIIMRECPSCNIIGSTTIENPYYLTVGEFYPTGLGVIYEISSVGSLGSGEVTNVTGPGYSDCSSACLAEGY